MHRYVTGDRVTGSVRATYLPRTVCTVAFSGSVGVVPSTRMHLPVHLVVCKGGRVSPHSPRYAPRGALGTCGWEIVFDKVARCSQRVG